MQPVGQIQFMDWPYNHSSGLQGWMFDTSGLDIKCLLFNNMNFKNVHVISHNLVHVGQTKSILNVPLCHCIGGYVNPNKKNMSFPHFTVFKLSLWHVQKLPISTK